MIVRLKNTDIAISQKIFTVFQLSYTIEAALLGATDFPPLKRSLENYRASTTVFFGYLKGKELAGVIEVEYTRDCTEIHSLVVAPVFFRQGIARKLMEFVFSTLDSDLFVVETGLENGPAIALYKGLNFKEIRQWDADHGIRKIQLERITAGPK